MWEKRASNGHCESLLQRTIILCHCRAKAMLLEDIYCSLGIAAGSFLSGVLSTLGTLIHSFICCTWFVLLRVAGSWITVRFNWYIFVFVTGLTSVYWLYPDTVCIILISRNQAFRQCITCDVTSMWGWINSWFSRKNSIRPADRLP